MAIILYAILFFFVNAENRKKHIESDVISYYAYLPALFIHHDLHLNYLKKNPEYYSDKVWPIATEDGRLVIKTSMGLAILYTPFFLLAHAFTGLSSYTSDGYSQPYHTSLVIACVFYLSIGLWALRKVLLRYFSDATSALTLLLIYFGTNLMWYTTREAAMAHGFIFSLLCVYLLQLLHWYDQPTFKRSLWVGLAGGMAILIRPTLALISLPFLLYRVDSLQSIPDKIRYCLSHYRFLLVLLLAAVLPFTLQMIYWKYATGHWLYFSYTGERFFFNNPHIFDGLFSYRKGWLIYTPLMGLSLIGLVLPNSALRPLRSGLLALTVAVIFINFSWWCWWYGGSFGQRSMIDYYGFLAIPFSIISERILRSALCARISMVLGIVFLVSWNFFQHWQFKEALISSDGMTRRSFWTEPFRTGRSERWLSTLRPPDYNRAKAGLAFDHPPLRENWEVYSLLDFEEGPELDTSVTTNAARSGKFGYTLEPGRRYTPPITARAYELKVRMIDSLIIGVDAFCTDAIRANSLALVFSLENDSALSLYRSDDLGSDEVFTGGQWHHFETRFRFSDCESNDKFKAYVLLAGEMSCLIDNLSLEYMQRKDYSSLPKQTILQNSFENADNVQVPQFFTFPLITGVVMNRDLCDPVLLETGAFQD